MLDKIRKFDNLEKFRVKKGEKFCQKHNISGMQLNFLVSTIAVERYEANKNK